MFRATTKKRKKVITRLQTDDSNGDESDTDKVSSKQPQKGNDDEDDDAQPSSISSKIKMKKSKKKSKSSKNKAMVVMSFDTNEEEDSDMVFAKKKKKRKRGGLGFGGSLMIETEPAEVEAEPTSASYYGKEALEELKSKQAFQAPVVAEDADNGTNRNNSPPPSPQQRKQQLSPIIPSKESSDPLDDDFVPFKKDGANMILTGDEAHLFESRNDDVQKDDHLDTVMEDASPFLHDNVEQQQQAEESLAWEAEITRRAGLSKTGKDSATAHSNGVDNTSGNISTNNSSTNNSSSVLSISKLREQLQSTIDQLKLQNEDMKQAAQRRHVELEQTKAEQERQENDVEEAGKALDYYQQLREQSACWVGALRDLHSKVQPIQDALIDLDADFANKTPWRDWEDDMCSVLHQAGYLDRVLGRQPDEAVFEDAVTVYDEFGRDVKSQQAMQREKRTKRRQEIRSQKQSQSAMEDDADAFHSDSEMEDLQQRRSALGKALEVAVEGLENGYTQLPSLVEVFRQWHSTYPEEFKQCYANLSLGDLASVLVQIDLCKSNGANSSSAASWIGGLGSFSTDDDGDDGLGTTFEWLSALGDDQVSGSKSWTSEAANRIAEKAFLPALTGLLDKSGYNLLSKRQSRALSAVYVRLQKLLQPPPGVQQAHAASFEFTKRLIQYIQSSLDNLAVIIINKDGIEFWSTQQAMDSNSNNPTADNKKQELREALRGATTGQLFRLSKMIRHVLLYWAPRLSPGVGVGDELVEFLLDFLSSKFLFLLSSLRNQQASHVVSDVFSDVWTVLKETKWLDDPEYMLHAAPLRAAAVAFNVA